jgi:hypothetical protein
MGHLERATMSTAARRPGRGSRRDRVVGGTWLLLALGLAVAKKRELPPVPPRLTLVPAPHPVAEPEPDAAAPTRATVAGLGRVLATTLWRSMIGIYFLGVVGFVFLAKTAFLPSLFNDPVFGVYGLVVTVYLLSRFVMSVFYRPCRANGPLPSVAIVIPAMNEQSAIERTIEAAFALDYRRS